MEEFVFSRTGVFISSLLIEGRFVFLRFRRGALWEVIVLYKVFCCFWLFGLWICMLLYWCLGKIALIFWLSLVFDFDLLFSRFFFAKNELNFFIRLVDSYSFLLISDFSESMDISRSYMILSSNLESLVSKSFVSFVRFIIELGVFIVYSNASSGFFITEFFTSVSCFGTMS